MLKIWKDLSVTKKLYAVIGVMTCLVTLELLTLLFAMNTLSTVRAFIGGNSNWSKAQKDATYNLNLFLNTKEEKYFSEFQRHIKICLGDRNARLELLKIKPNFDLAYSGLIEGGLHPEDIPGIVRMVRYFKKFPYIKDSLEIWARGDELITLLQENGNQLHTALRSEVVSEAQVKELVVDTYSLNQKLTAIEDSFATILGEGSRWLENLLMMTLACIVIVVGGASLLVTIALNRALSRSLMEINKAAKNLGHGNFSEMIPVHSNDELGELASTLNQMTRDLEANILQRIQAENMNQLKTLFLANISHEIRTPLGVILGMTEIIKDENIPTSERRKYIEIIGNTGKNLTQIINDLLDITKVESGHLQIKKDKTDVTQVVQEVSDMLRIKAESNGDHLEIIKKNDIPATVFTDRSRLQQILINLVNNAIKFTSNGVVQIQYGISEGMLFFDIVDTGIGIPKDFQKQLFQIFSQLDPSSTRKYEGTGLGLALSKKIAQSLGGDIVLLKSEVDKGSTFRIKIDANLHEAGEVLQKTNDENPKNELQLKDKRILIVDDSHDNQLLIELYLKKSGLLSDFADNGKIACEKVQKEQYDLVLMDMQMPIMDGYTATKAMRDAGFKKPIIALTAHAMSEDRNRCLSVGCNDYLTKPIDYSTLNASIIKLLKENHS